MSDEQFGAGKTKRPEVTIVKKATDPVCTRVSLGGMLESGFFYCTYRGTRQEAIIAMEAVLLELKRLTAEPPVSPDDGKQFA